MRNRMLIQMFVFALGIAIYVNTNSMTAQTGQVSTNTVGVNVMVDQTALVAIQAAATSAGYATITGKVHTIPLSALSAAATHLVHLRISKWLSCVQLCKQFQIWALSHKRTPPFVGDPAFDAKINLTDASGTVVMVVTVPFFAKCNTIDSKGVAHGYIAPIGSQGATMKLDVFGTGELILERIDCPCK